jgi:hypothetical protein
MTTHHVLLNALKLASGHEKCPGVAKVLQFGIIAEENIHSVVNVVESKVVVLVPQVNDSVQMPYGHVVPFAYPFSFLKDCFFHFTEVSFTPFAVVEEIKHSS